MKARNRSILLIQNLLRIAGGRLARIAFCLVTLNIAMAQDPPSNPRITPTNRCVSIGAMTTFQLAVAGTSPFQYQWYYTNSGNCSPLDGVANASAVQLRLSLTNVQTCDSGGYFVVVTNEWGSTTSPVVPLRVDPTFTKITAGPLAKDNEASCYGAWGDYDNDGRLDLFVANSLLWGGGQKNSLYRNLGGDAFVRITNALMTRVAVSWCGQWADFDNDGDIDLFVLHPFTPGAGSGDRNEMFRSDGGGVFTRLTNAATAVSTYHTDASWVDHDGDGFLDVFVSTQNGAKKFFFQNQGDGTFKAWTTNEVGPVLSVTASTGGVMWCDLDGDGDLDLHLANSTGRNFLYHNDGGKLVPITAGSLPGARGMWGGQWADFNNDGLFDLFTSGENSTNMLHLNRGNWQFQDVTTTSGLAWSGNCYSPAAGDFDNDGDLDLYMPNYSGRDVLYVNQGDATFVNTDIGSPLADGISDGAVWVDYNGDGFLDLFKSCGDLNPAPNLLYRNSLQEAGNTNHWLEVRLEGTASNRSAIGARLWVRAMIGGRKVQQVRQIVSSGNAGSTGGGFWVHFGLGDATVVDSLRIEWPSGIVQELIGVATRQLLNVIEPPRLSVLGPTSFGIACWKSQTVEVQNSTDLIHWEPLVQLTNVSGELAYADPAMATSPRRFYRVVAK